MEDDFLANSLVFYIERKIVESFDLYLIFDDFIFLKDRIILFFFNFFYLCLIDIVPTC
jgi:hypothetical protein